MLLKKNKFILSICFLLYILPTPLFSEDKSVIIDKQLAEVSNYIVHEDFTQALALLYILSNAYPQNNHVYRLYAIVSLKLKDYERAKTFIEKAILLAQTESDNYILAGNIYREKNEFEKAKNYYETAIKLSPNSALAYYEYAILNLRNAYIREAERLLALSINFDGQAWYNMLLKAQIAQYKQEYQVAQDIFFKIIDQFPYEEILLDEFAKFYLFYKKPEKALVILETANKRFGEKFERIESIGNILFEQGFYEKSLTFYKKIEALDTMFHKDMSALRWRLYNLYLLLGQKDMAIINLKQAFEFDPQNQLYIVALYGYFSKNASDKGIKPFVDFLERMAKKEKLYGVSLEYLSLLRKIISLDSQNTYATKDLLNYAKLQQDEYSVHELIENIYKSHPSKKIANQLALRNHLDKTGRFTQKPFPVYKYVNLVFIENNSDCLSESIKTELENIEYFFPNLLSIFELEKNFKNESRHIFSNNKEFNLVTYIKINKDAKYFDIMIFDKKGIPIENIKQYYSSTLLTKYLIAYTKKISSLLPIIGYVLKKLPDSKFEISLGAADGLTEKDTLSILNKDAKEIGFATVESVNPRSAIIKQNGITTEFLDIESAFLTIKETVPKVDKKKTKKDLEETNTLNLLDRVFQVQYKKTESLSTDSE